ncbi:MAG: hypothetical protein ACXW31_04290, partial [Thermoanaerobaculia bacterium]
MSQNPIQGQITHLTLPVDVVQRALLALGERKINEAIDEWLDLRKAADDSVAVQVHQLQQQSQSKSKD